MSDDLISRRELLRAITEEIQKTGNEPITAEYILPSDGLMRALLLVRGAPTVPAEIVVHCRGCRKRNTPRCNMTHNMGGGRFLTCNEDLGYCNLAEMKHTEINKGEGDKKQHIDIYGNMKEK